ncbi:MAG TPA: hypothetical protein VFU63_09650, partial [Ktedonobacterales bacterium]|nr:hypothetical protein [Ktedonobacterales bacterium]
MRGGRWLALVVGCFMLMLGLALQAYGFSPDSTAHSAPLIHADNNPADTPTATIPSNPPALSLAVPSS